MIKLRIRVALDFQGDAQPILFVRFVGQVQKLRQLTLSDYLADVRFRAFPC